MAQFVRDNGKMVAIGLIGTAAAVGLGLIGARIVRSRRDAALA